MNRMTLSTVIAAGIFLLSCAPQQEEPATAEPTVGLADLEALYDTTDLQDYRNWGLFPGTTEMMDGARGDGPHGRYVTVYANGVASESVGADEMSMPDGATLVKDAFDADKGLKATVMMTKRGGSWIYGTFKSHDVDTVQFMRFAASGTDDAAMCQDCHADASRDFVFMWK